MVVAIGAALAFGVLLVAVGRQVPGTSASSATSAAVPRSVSAGEAGPASEAAGLPVGFSHDEHGVVTAAIAYATAPQRWLYFTDDQITAAVREIATPTETPRLANEVVADVRKARQQLGTSPGRIWWLVRPLAWRAESVDSHQATVVVWTVTVLSAQDVAAPQCEWVTVTVGLAWVEGDWRVDSVRDTPGPTPLTGPGDQPWDAGPFDKALAGFTRIDGEPVA